GQHACLVADALGMTKILIHPYSSLLSAYGMGLADIRASRQQAIEEPLPDGPAAREFDERLIAVIETLAARAQAELLQQNVPGQEIQYVIKAHARYSGTDTALIYGAASPGADAEHEPPVPHDESPKTAYAPTARNREPPSAHAVRVDGRIVASFNGAANVRRSFHTHHRERFGFADPEREVILEAVSVEAIGGGAKFSEGELPRTTAALPAPARHTRFFSSGAWHRADVFTRDQLSPGH